MIYEGILCKLEDSEEPEHYNELFYISSEILTDENIKLIRRIEEEWFDETLKNDEIRIIDKDIDVLRKITSDGVTCDTSAYHEISSILSNMENKSLNKQCKITGRYITFVG